MAPGAVTAVVDRVKGRLSYAGWGFADQAMSSLSNFGVGLVAVRSSSSEEYGAFSVAFATSVIGIGVARALVSDVYSVRFAGGGARSPGVGPLDTSLGGSADPELQWIEAESAAREDGADVEDPIMEIDFGDDEDETTGYPHASGAWGAALVLSLVASLVCLVVALVSSGPLHQSMLILTVGMPFLVLQDVVRFVCISRQDAFGATLSDGTWVVAFAIGIGVIRLVTGSGAGANAALAVWILGAACGVVVGAFRMAAIPRIRDGVRFARLVWHQSLRYVLDWLALGASVQVGLYLLGATAGLAVLGETRTAFLLTGPINIVIMGATMVLVPELTRYRRRSGSRLFYAAAGISGFLLVASLAWLAIIALLPEHVLETILGDAAAGARSYLWPLAVCSTVVMLAQGPLVCLRATGDIRRGTWASLPTAPFMLLGASIGAAITGDAPGAIIGTAIGYGVSGAMCTIQLVLATRSSPIVFDLGLDRGAAGAASAEKG